MTNGASEAMEDFRRVFERDRASLHRRARQTVYQSRPLDLPKQSPSYPAKPFKLDPQPPYESSQAKSLLRENRKLRQLAASSTVDAMERINAAHKELSEASNEIEDHRMLMELVKSTAAQNTIGNQTAEICPRKEKLFSSLALRTQLDDEATSSRKESDWGLPDDERVTQFCKSLIEGNKEADLAYCLHVLMRLKDINLMVVVKQSVKDHIREIPGYKELDVHYQQICSTPPGATLSRSIKNVTHIDRQDDPMIAAINTNTADAHLDTRAAKFDYKHELDCNYYTGLLFCKAQELDAAFQTTVREALQPMHGIHIVPGEVKSMERMQENIQQMRAALIPWPRCVHILDPIRCWVTCLEASQIIQVISTIKAWPELKIAKLTNTFWQPEDRHAHPSHGYRGVTLNCAFESQGAKIVTEIRVTDVRFTDWYQKTSGWVRLYAALAAFSGT